MNDFPVQRCYYCEGSTAPCSECLNRHYNRPPSPLSEMAEQVASLTSQLAEANHDCCQNADLIRDLTARLEETRTTKDAVIHLQGKHILQLEQKIAAVKAECEEAVSLHGSPVAGALRVQARRVLAVLNAPNQKGLAFSALVRAAWANVCTDCLSFGPKHRDGCINESVEFPVMSPITEATNAPGYRVLLLSQGEWWFAQRGHDGYLTDFRRAPAELKTHLNKHRQLFEGPLGERPTLKKAVS